MPAGQVTRRTLGLGALLTAGLGPWAPAWAQEGPALATGEQQRGLLTTPVRINDGGPYAFAIDTAANASVIARDLAEGLGLAEAGEVTMHTVVGGERASTVRANRLRTGALDVRRPRLVVASRANLDGVDGLLGTDLLSGLRLVLNFRGRTRINVTRPRRGGERGPDGLQLDARATTPGEQRFNGLLLIDAMAGSTAAKVIVDTGARTTIINPALALQAGARPLVLPDGSTLTRVVSPSGQGAVVEAMLLPELRLGGVQLSRIPVLVGDIHTFGLWNLSETPAMLLGVDLLGLFETVVIDLKRGEVRLDP